MIEFKMNGSFKKANTYLNSLREKITGEGYLDHYAKKGVEALQLYTPKDTGLTALSWYYNIERKDGEIIINWNNSNIKDYVNIALIIQYGHATKNGYFIQGQDYINPALKPIFDEIADKIWKEVSK